MTIENRMKILERRLSITRWSLILVILIFVGVNAWKSKTIIPVVEAQQVDNDQKVIRSKTFILEDKDGKIRGIWGLSDEGNPVLQLYDKNGKARASIGMDKISDKVTPRFMLLDRDENQSAGIFSTKEGSMLILNGRNSQRITAAVYKNDPSIRMFDEKGIERISLVVKKDTVCIALLDKNGKVVEGLGK
jgi:predicted transcriptional regulator